MTESPTMYEIHCFEGKHVPVNYLDVVRSRWARTYRHCNDYMKLIYPPAYYFAYDVYIKRILERQKVEVRIAVLQDDHDVVLGFSVTEGTNILHYVEVKRVMRRNGIANALVPDRIDWFTHLTKTGLRIWSRKNPDAKFSPFL